MLGSLVSPYQKPELIPSVPTKNAMFSIVISIKFDLILLLLLYDSFTAKCSIITRSTQLCSLCINRRSNYSSIERKERPLSSSQFLSFTTCINIAVESWEIDILMIVSVHKKNLTENLPGQNHEFHWIFVEYDIDTNLQHFPNKKFSFSWKSRYFRTSIHQN